MKNKRILILFGSPNENGHTRKMVNKLKEELKGCEFFEFNAYKELVKPCYGCNKCKDTGVCCLDDFNKINYYINDIKPEILVIASPIYNFGFPAPLKAFFDRFQPYYNNPKKNIFLKKSILLLTSGKKICYKNELVEKINIILKPLDFKIEHLCIWDQTDFYKSEMESLVYNCIKSIYK